jgi:tRNA A37 threonylcarbamoyladenosine dehydratase
MLQPVLLDLVSDVSKTSHDEINKYLRTVIIAPLKTSSKNYPTGVEVIYDPENLINEFIFQIFNLRIKIAELKSEGNSLRQRECFTVVDSIGLPSHINFP